jgi:micrococcal nuclease
MPKTLTTWLLLFAICTINTNCYAEPHLVKVLDGDTVIIRDDAHTYHLRLLDIDAPESQQSFGKQSKRSLSELCRETIAVGQESIDMYGRTLGHLYCNNIDASEFQIAQGMAWFNSRYSKRTDLELLQQQAQQQALGLWQQEKPVPPWVWRKRYGQHYRQ